jgi:hypothetical protein
MLRVALLAVFLALAGRGTCAYPLYVSANGTALLRSAYGGDVVLRPDAGGTVVASSVFLAQGGVALNNTLLEESTITTLQSQVASLQGSIVGQVTNLTLLSDKVAEYASVAPVQLSGPPECGPPGGDRLQFVNGNWICVCASSWFGTECTSLYSSTTLAGSGGFVGFVDGAGSSAMFYNPRGVAVDSAGNVYVADLTNQRIRVVSPNGTVSTLAGSGSNGFADGVGSSAMFYDPQGVAVDTAGNVYVADSINNRIRVVSPNGTVSTLAGGSNSIGYPGFLDGPGSSAMFYGPRGVAVDTAGTVYVADTVNHRIRVVSPNGTVSTLAGGSSWGYADGVGPAAQFNSPQSVAVDSAGNVYVADTGNNRIRVVTNGTVSTLAGSGVASFADGAGLSAQFSSPQSVAVDGAGNVYVAEDENHRIRFVSPSGIVKTLAGNGISSFADGAGLSAQFISPLGIAVNSAGTVVVVADNNANRPLIRKLVLIATGASSPQTAPAAMPLVTSLSALATQLADLAVVPNISALVAEYASLAPVQLSGPPECGPPGGDRLQYVNGSWICVCASSWFGTECTSVYNVTTLAGDGNRGFVDGAGIAAEFDNPQGVAVDTAGNVYVAESNNHRIRVVSPSGTVSTLAGSGSPGSANGVGPAAQFYHPAGVAVDTAGNVYVADSNNHRIRVVSPSGTVSTLAGNGSPGFANGVGPAAQFNNPNGVAVDTAGNVYVADYYNNLIRVVSPSGTVSTLAGSGSPGYANGVGPAAQFYNPNGVAVDTAGNVYVADFNNNLIRVVSPSGTVSTLAGSGSPGYANGVGPAAQFYNPTGVAVDTAGNVYVADSNNHRIRVVSPSGTVSTLAGSGGGFANGPGPSSRFYSPTGVAVDTAGSVYVADYGNLRIRKLIMFATSNASLAQQTASASPLVTSLSALAAQLAAQEATTVSLQQAQQPPLCMPPGGDRLLYNGSAWVCLCFAGWTGTSCTVSPSPPLPPPSPSPPSPPSPPMPPPLPPFPPAIGCVVSGPNGSCLFESSSFATVLDGVSSISAVCVGGGGSSDCNVLCAAGGGGALSWTSSFPVSKGMILSVGVGTGGVLYGGNNHGGPGRNSGGSSNITVNGTLILLADGGAPAYMDTGGQGGLASQLANTTSHSGGSGGSWQGQPGLGGWPGGGGAAGYSGNGGDGGSWQTDGFDGTGGGGGGGESHEYGSYGGGVGLFGEGPSGTGGSCAIACGIPSGNGGAGSVQYGTTAYGGGGCRGDAGPGMPGACRIIWGNGCTYPNNAGPQCHS